MKLKRFKFNLEDLIGDKLYLLGQEATHAYSVMRLKVGDKLVAFCGDGKDYFCEILNINKNAVECKIEKIENNLADAKVDICVYQAMLKADKLELITQKITEIGIKELNLFESEFCVAKLKDNNNKIERLNKITLESSKQCGRSIPLKIDTKPNFKSMLESLKNYDLVLFAYEGQRVNKITQIQGDYNKIAIIIGSEGGFSDNEYNELMQLKNVQCVTLGNRILRAETACIVASALAVEHFEK